MALLYRKERMNGRRSMTSAASASDFTIGQLAGEFGVTLRALRFYEDEGLLTPRRDGGARFYSDHDRERLTWIIRGKRLGFSLAEIRDLIALNERYGDSGTQWHEIVERCRARIDRLAAQKVEIDHALDELGEVVSFLTSGANQGVPAAGQR